MFTQRATRARATRWRGGQGSNLRPAVLETAALPAELPPQYSLGAGNEDRTRGLNLGKVALCHLSYSRELVEPFEQAPECLWRPTHWRLTAKPHHELASRSRSEPSESAASTQLAAVIGARAGRGPHTMGRATLYPRDRCTRPAGNGCRRVDRACAAQHSAWAVALQDRPTALTVMVVEPVGIEPTTLCLQSRCSPS